MHNGIDTDTDASAITTETIQSKHTKLRRKAEINANLLQRCSSALTCNDQLNTRLPVKRSKSDGRYESSYWLS